MHPKVKPGEAAGLALLHRSDPDGELQLNTADTRLPLVFLLSCFIMQAMTPCLHALEAI